MAQTRFNHSRRASRDSRFLDFRPSIEARRTHESADDNGEWRCTGNFGEEAYFSGDLTFTEAIRLARSQFLTENYLFRLLQPFGVMPEREIFRTTGHYFDQSEMHPRTRAQLVANYVLKRELEAVFGSDRTWISLLRAANAAELDVLTGGAIRIAVGLPHVRILKPLHMKWIDGAMSSRLYPSIDRARKACLDRTIRSPQFPTKPYPGLRTIGAPLPVKYSARDGKTAGWFIGAWEQDTLVWIFTEDLGHIDAKYRVYQLREHPMIPCSLHAQTA